MLAGLLHGSGKFYILTRARPHAELFADEAAVWGVVDQWHAHIPAAILESWQVPDEIGVAVRDHREFNREHKGPADLTDVLMASDFLDGIHRKAQIQEVDGDRPPAAIAYLGLNREMTQELDQIVKALS